MRNASCPTETQDQIALMEWRDLAKARYPELVNLVHVANEGKRTYQSGKQLKRMGLRKGFPDLVLLVPRGEYCGLSIELKRADRSTKPSPEQMDCLGDLMVHGKHKTCVCYGFEEARKTILKYLEAGR